MQRADICIFVCLCMYMFFIVCVLHNVYIKIERRFGRKTEKELFLVRTSTTTYRRRGITNASVKKVLPTLFHTRRVPYACVAGVMVSIAAFQAVDPGSIPGQRTFLQGGHSLVVKRWVGSVGRALVS